MGMANKIKLRTEIINDCAEGGLKMLDLPSFNRALKAKSVQRYLNGFLVSKETVVLRRWGRSKQKFGFIKRVDKC